MDVSAVNDICNGTYIYKQKVLNHISQIPCMCWFNNDFYAGKFFKIYCSDWSLLFPRETLDLRFFNELANLSKAINKVAKMFDIDTPNATVHKKVVSTAGADPGGHVCPPIIFGHKRSRYPNRAVSSVY